MDWPRGALSRGSHSARCEVPRLQGRRLVSSARRTVGLSGRPLASSASVAVSVVSGVSRAGGDRRQGTQGGALQAEATGHDEGQRGRCARTGVGLL